MKGDIGGPGEKKGMKMKKIVLMLFLFLAFCGVSRARDLDPGSVEDKLFYYEYHGYEINITSMPSGARIYIDDEYVGESPVTYYAEGKISKLHNIIFEARPQVKHRFHYPQEFKVDNFSIIPRHIHFDMLHPDK